MTNGAGSPANNFVFFSMMPEITIAAMPTKYAEGATHQAPPNNALEIRAMIGSFAPQGIKVVVMMVIRRSRSFSMVRDAIMPGTPHPVPISMGIKDFPLRRITENTVHDKCNPCHIPAGFQKCQQNKQYQHLGNEPEARRLHHPRCHPIKVH